MVYEERIINGVLHYRADPDGLWIQYSREAVCCRYSALSQENAALRAELEQYKRWCEQTPSASMWKECDELKRQLAEARRVMKNISEQTSEAFIRTQAKAALGTRGEKGEP